MKLSQNYFQTYKLKRQRNKACSPQTNGLTEAMNKIIELRKYLPRTGLHNVSSETNDICALRDLRSAYQHVAGSSELGQRPTSLLPQVNYHDGQGANLMVAFTFLAFVASILDYNPVHQAGSHTIAYPHKHTCFALQYAPIRPQPVHAYQPQPIHRRTNISA
ncbi:hypothetical protein PR048_016346 [Dryococelus australis]|uniref:Integrase catalytic domain-containing protein n=1 Tax=Dryococelus australis TaxID=614101 RepID=A0ABQ9HJI3_9NEOP|nr:hypothetical protein PR048_016346 [Dryococelus australis]